MVGHPYFFGGASGTGEMSGHLIPEHSATRSKDVPCTHLSLSDAEFSILSSVLFLPPRRRNQECRQIIRIRDTLIISNSLLDPSGYF